MKILTLNAGSNSLKFEIIEAEPTADKSNSDVRFGRSLVSGSYDDIGKQHSKFSLARNTSHPGEQQVKVEDHGQATDLLFDWIEHAGAREHGIHNLGDVERIGHRIVHGADMFNAPAQISDEVIRRIEALDELAPLHNVSALKVVRAAQARVSDRVPMIAVFDTVFHRTIPPEAALYALPCDVAQRNKIRRYGFHGISHRYMLIRYAQITRRPLNELNVITLHLEGGSSATAIRRGKSIDTSMGLTPLEGLIMGTRCGDIDPAIVTYLMRKELMDPARIEKFLNKECGLLGVSGLSADTRELREHLSEKRVNLAVDLFCYRVRKYIGAYLATLEGAEAIIAGGGISENTAIVRERIFEKFGWCGAILDRERNRETVDREGPITTPESSMAVWVIPTKENLMIAKDVADFELS
jgi:acetate kinase